MTLDGGTLRFRELATADRFLVRSCAHSSDRGIASGKACDYLGGNLSNSSDLSFPDAARNSPQRPKRTVVERS